MIKRYYSLDEAVAYLSERTDKKVSLRDLFDLIQLQAVRLCCWYAGNVALLNSNPDGYHGDDIFLGFFRFRGYVASNYDLHWVSRPFIEGTNTVQTYHVSTFEIIECVGHPLPPIQSGEEYMIWNRDFPRKEYVGMPVHEVECLEDPESKYASASISVTRDDVLIPATDLESVLAGRPLTQTDQPTEPQKQAIPAYLSPSHESYPPELATAIMLWEGLYIRGEKSQHHPHTQAAKGWLKRNLDRLPTAGLPNATSDAMINRLTTITAPADRKPKK